VTPSSPLAKLLREDNHSLFELEKEELDVLLKGIQGQEAGPG
jgi:hypothetical protein